VLVEVDLEQVGALLHLVAVHACGEGRLLQLLLHGLRLEPVQSRRPDEPAGMDEAGELVAREEGLLERRVPRKAEVLRVREDSLDDLLGIALFAKNRRPVLRVLVERGVDLVVEVVEKRDDAPELLVLAELPRVEPRRRLHGERVTQERLALRVTSERLPCLIARRFHGSLGYRGAADPRT
jgi:hypothetical protein